MSTSKKKPSCLLFLVKVLLVLGNIYFFSPFILRFMMSGYWLGTDDEVNQRYYEKLLRRDEKILRQDFKIPKGATVVAMETIPRRDWRILRESYKISATFSFKSADFDAYLAQAEQDNQWQPLPPSDSFLIKILGIRSYIKGIRLHYEYHGKPLPKPGSPDNPTAEQLLARRRKNLPLDVSRGLYRCLTSGYDILFDKKVPCSEKPEDLNDRLLNNDYMFGVLDLDKKILRIEVQTYR